MILMSALFRLGLVRDRRQIHREVGPEHRRTELDVQRQAELDAREHAEALFASLRERVERVSDAMAAPRVPARRARTH